MDFHVHKRTVIAATAVLAATIIVLGFLFVNTYKKVAPARIITPNRISELVRRHATLGVSDIPTISSWMTFDYINRVFVLPPDYLKSWLGLDDKRYPALSLAQYAKESSADPSVVVSRVQDAVGEYLDPQL